MNWIKSKWFPNLIFSLVFVGLCLLYNFDETFFQSPQSIHTWRQTNGLSITQMYYEFNLNFLQPEIQNQLGDDGMSGQTAGEFPIIYFAVAKMWQLFGKAEWSFRILQLLILFSGIFLLFRLLVPLTGNALRAGFISMLVFTSPMFIFYGPNFLPDAPALAFTFGAWYFLYSYIVKKKTISLWISAIFFFLAITLKITTATSFLAIGLWVIIESIFIKSENRIFRFRFAHYIPFIVCVLFAIGWYWYIDYYNDLHQADFSVRGIWPIWNMADNQFDRIIDAVNKIFFKEFFFPPLQYATILIWLFLLFKIRNVAPFFRFLLIIMPLGFAATLALWFQVLEAHDYYMITQMQVLVIVWAIFFIYMKDKKLWRHPVAHILLILVFGLLANNAIVRHNARYEGWMNEGFKLHMEALTEIQPYFEKWNILPQDKVISIPDYSINTSLYYMSRKGYTEFGSDFSQQQTFRKRIFQGAKYLIINDTSLLEQPLIQKFTNSFVGQYKNVKVFSLKPVIH